MRYRCSVNEADGLRTYLAGCTPLAHESVTWADGHIELQLTTYITEAIPPMEFVTSVRCLVFREDTVLVQRDLDGMHVLPGGRREGDESIEQTLRRELLEETGWTIDAPQLLGCVHFHHLTPRPAGHVYPYPDFVQVVFMAEAARYLAERMVDDEYLVESVFRPVAEARELALTPGQRLLLDAALKRRTSFGE
jgi:ADP-ribose pyrophosphatase YjhB (NUDIX family)